MTRKELVHKLLCEKLVNESWGGIAVCYDDLEKIFEQGGPHNDKEQAIILLAACVALQKLTLDHAVDQEFTEAEIFTD